MFIFYKPQSPNGDLLEYLNSYKKITIKNTFILEREPDGQFEQVGDIFISRFLRKNVGDNEDGLVNKLVDGLVDNQKKILQLIRANPKISIKDLSTKINISKSYTNTTKYLDIKNKDLHCNTIITRRLKECPRASVCPRIGFTSYKFNLRGLRVKLFSRQ